MVFTIQCLFLNVFWSRYTSRIIIETSFDGPLVACLLRCTHIETSTFHFQTGIVRNHNEERVLCDRRTRVSQQQSRVRPSHGLRPERKRIYTTTSLESEVRTGKCTITIHIMSKYGNYPGRLPYLQLVNMT